MEIDYFVPLSSSGATVLSTSTIADILYPQLSVAEILSLSKVCKATYRAVKAWYPSAYNINNHFKTFLGTLKNVLAFRGLQAITGTIVSGSQALQFFDRTYYPGSDLDVYVPCRHASAIGEFFLSIGYLFKPTSLQSASAFGSDCKRHLDDLSSRTPNGTVPGQEIQEYNWRFVEGVINFTKEVILGDEETLKVQLIAVEPQSSPLTCVLHFHSSLVMNLIAHDRAYSLFPRATFIKRTGVTFGNSGRLESVTKAYNKYMMRNFKISRDPLPPSSRNPLLVYGDRWIGDRQSWTIALDTAGVTIPYWVKEANDYLGLPLLACQGFSVRNTQPRQPTVQNPAPKHYQNGDVLLTFELVCCTILRLPLVLPISDSPSRSYMWPRSTSYPVMYSFMMSASHPTFSLFISCF
ncbi:hypothetical protein FRB91_003552 [Serendipita sp. 411]|nr:hypothetical protein FRC16_005712 [Serendipita sp. 398]KAG8843172.1 hypothetical protein FRB91_003552 [Serendipita sp. 411]